MKSSLEDPSGKVSLKWFRYRKLWLQKQFPVGQKLLVIGEVKHFSGIREIHHPETERIDEETNADSLLANDPVNFGRILPVYPLTEGLSQKQARKIWFPLVQQYAELIPSFVRPPFLNVTVFFQFPRP